MFFLISVKRNEKKLAVVKTQNAICPLVWGANKIFHLSFSLGCKKLAFLFSSNILLNLSCFLLLISQYWPGYVGGTKICFS
jgi:hypothetical protein